MIIVNSGVFRNPKGKGCPGGTFQVYTCKNVQNLAQKSFSHYILVQFYNIQGAAGARPSNTRRVYKFHTRLRKRSYDSLIISTMNYT